MAIGKQVGVQTISIIATIVYCSVLSFIILKIVDVIIAVFECMQPRNKKAWIYLSMVNADMTCSS